MTDNYCAPTAVSPLRRALRPVRALRDMWSRHQDPAPPGADTGARPDTGHTGPQALGAGGMPPAGGTSLWRMRTTVRDQPGSLAALCTALAEQHVDILSLQTHPLGEGTVDEFLLRAPLAVTEQVIRGAVSGSGGTETWLERADSHDLVDAPTRILALATRTALDAAELPLALRQLLGRCSIRSVPATSHTGRQQPPPAEDDCSGTVMRLRSGDGGSILVDRPYLPFTPTEFARARALVELDTRMGTRLPAGEDTVRLPPAHTQVTLRRAGTADVAAAKSMHERCSRDTLSKRYHGPVGDADRYLGHLLSPRFGRTLAARGDDGRIVALGHLLWDGDETEVALLVEDAWQHRGLGRELLGRLVGLAVEAGCESVYAVTQPSNKAMIAAMRSLGLPLDFQSEAGALVVTARLEATPVASSLPYDSVDGPGARGRG